MLYLINCVKDLFSICLLDIFSSFKEKKYKD